MLNNLHLEIKKYILQEGEPKTLSEIYEKFNYLNGNFTDYKAVIRTTIYRNCIDRDLNIKKTNLFFSINEKGSKGNKYALVEWVNVEGDNITQKEIDLYLEDINTLDFKYKNIEIIKFIRSRKALEFALNKANNICEKNNRCVSFIKKSNGKNYVEGHHLIPLEYQSEYIINLDIPENILALCSNCHNQLHYGVEYLDLLKFFFDKRVNELNKKGIDITFDKLCKYYK